MALQDAMDSIPKNHVQVAVQVVSKKDNRFWWRSDYCKESELPAVMETVKHMFNPENVLIFVIRNEITANLHKN